MRMPPLRSVWLTSFLLLCLVGCHFRLQGFDRQSALPPALHQLYFTSATPYHPLSRQLKLAFQRNGIILVANRNQAPWTLAIINIHDTIVQTTQSVRSISTRAYLLTTYLTFTITNPKGVPVTHSTTIQASRSFILPANVLLDNSDEASIARQSLQEPLIERLFSRLSSNALVTQLNIAAAHSPSTTMHPAIHHEN